MLELRESIMSWMDGREISFEASLLEYEHELWTSEAVSTETSLDEVN